MSLLNLSHNVFSDFGLSRITITGEYAKLPEFRDDGASNDQIPIRWSAPEILQYLPATSKSDVWSFGKKFLSIILK